MYHELLVIQNVKHVQIGIQTKCHLNFGKKEGDGVIEHCSYCQGFYELDVSNSKVP